MLKILVPEMAGLSAIAAGQFAALWQQVTGQRLEITEKDDPTCDLIFLGPMLTAAHGIFHGDLYS